MFREHLSDFVPFFFLARYGNGRIEIDVDELIEKFTGQAKIE
jgi:hypothetical protein